MQFVFTMEVDSGLPGAPQMPDFYSRLSSYNIEKRIGRVSARCLSRNLFLAGWLGCLGGWLWMRFPFAWRRRGAKLSAHPSVTSSNARR